MDNRYLLNALNYVVATLDEPSLCLQAANALRELCDANRTKLAGHVADFGQLHARLPSIPVGARTLHLDIPLKFNVGFRKTESHSVNIECYTGPAARAAN